MENVLYNIIVQLHHVVKTAWRLWDINAHCVTFAVTVQLSGGYKRFVAHRALIGTHPQVVAFVHHQSRVLGKTFHANVTRVRLLASVNAKVSGVIGPCVECLAASLANQRSLASVHLQVIL